jgi:hypothetical protein
MFVLACATCNMLVLMHATVHIQAAVWATKHEPLCVLCWLNAREVGCDAGSRPVSQVGHAHQQLGRAQGGQHQ